MNTDYENNGFNNVEEGQMVNGQDFGDPVPNQVLETVKDAKLALELGLISLLGSLGGIFVYFVLNRIIFIIGILPLIAIAGIVIAIKTIIKDKGLPKAYIGLVLNILGLLPSLFCTLILILDTIARFS